MKKLFTILAVAMYSTLAMAQTNQYFWVGGQFIMGNPINQIDSVTFGQLEETDSVLLYLPRTVKVIHDTVIQYVTIHDTINPCAVPDGAISGKFSVSETKKVYFSKGNLQYQASTDTWRFAEKQYEYVGSNNQYISSTYSSWIDLFGWATSGYNNKYPYLHSTSSDDYHYNTDIANTNYDWGIYNQIENGGSKGSWRNLTEDEWVYLFTERTNASSLYSQATIGNVTGVIILPDDWNLNIQFTPISNNYSTNTYSLAVWQQMEDNGAIFLPAAGYRNGTYIGNIQTFGYYWYSTGIDIPNKGCRKLAFRSGFINPTNDGDHVYMGFSVRLVHEVK